MRKIINTIFYIYPNYISREFKGVVINYNKILKLHIDLTYKQLLQNLFLFPFPQFLINRIRKAIRIN